MIFSPFFFGGSGGLSLKSVPIAPGKDALGTLEEPSLQISSFLWGFMTVDIGMGHKKER